MPSRARASALGRCIWFGGCCRGLGVGDELPVDGVRDPPLQAGHGFRARLPGSEFASVVGATLGVERIWVVAAMCNTRFILRFPARDNQWRVCSPEDASSGAVPVQD